MDGRTGGGPDEPGAWLTAFRELTEDLQITHAMLVGDKRSERQVGRAMAGKGGVSTAFYRQLVDVVVMLLRTRRNQAAREAGVSAGPDEDPTSFAAACLKAESTADAWTRDPRRLDRRRYLDEARKSNDGYRTALELKRRLVSVRIEIRREPVGDRDGVGQDRQPPHVASGGGDGGRRGDGDGPEDSGGGGGRGDDGRETGRDGVVVTTWGGSARLRRAGWATLALVGALGAAAAFVRLTGTRTQGPPLTLQTASETRSHLGEASGLCPAGDTAQRIRLYVSPHDTLHTYWLQNGPDAACDVEGRWRAPVRFGNDSMADMAVPLPLRFTVFAVAVPDDVEAAFPGTPESPRVTAVSDEAFVAALMKLGARDLARAVVLRVANDDGVGK